jgi:hypothetical protein
MRRNLVIVRAGDNSLHREWLGPERSWDLVVSYYGSNPKIFTDNDTLRIDHPGSKWTGLTQLFASGRVDWQAYDLIWLPDDDLSGSCETINAFFDATRSINANLSQPALTWDSYFSHIISLESKAFFFRYTTFIEIMAPCFSSRFLRQALPTFSENTSGWGLDYLWPNLLQQWGLAPPVIIDRTPVRHTRPVGVAGHGSGPGISPKNELLEILQKHKVPAIQINIAGVTRKSQRLSLFREREAMIGHLVTGLIEKLNLDVAFGQYVLSHAMVKQTRSGGTWARRY